MVIDLYVEEPADIMLTTEEQDEIPLAFDSPIGSGPLKPATTTTLGGIIVGDDLQITQEGILSVQKATSVEEDNTHPITAAAVYTEVGNINALLATI